LDGSGCFSSRINQTFCLLVFRVHDGNGLGPGWHFKVIRIEMNYPIQPIEYDAQGIIRFKENAIVRYLLDAGPLDLNKLEMLEFSDEDRAQFEQLIGRSVSAFCGLDCVSDEVADKVSALSEALQGEKSPDPESHINALAESLAAVDDDKLSSALAYQKGAAQALEYLLSVDCDVNTARGMLHGYKAATQAIEQEQLARAPSH